MNELENATVTSIGSKPYRIQSCPVHSDFRLGIIKESEMSFEKGGL